MMSTVRDYTQFCQMLLSNGIAQNAHRILQAATVKSLWKDALAAYSRADGRLRGWNDADGPGTRGGVWDYTGCSLLHTHLVFDDGPSDRKTPRQGKSMWMSGGGGCYWVVDAKCKLVSVTFLQGFGGGDSCNDAYPFAKEAMDGIDA